MRPLPWHVAARADVPALLTVLGVALGVAFSVLGTAIPAGLNGFAISDSNAFAQLDHAVSRADGRPFDPTDAGVEGQGYRFVQARLANGSYVQLFSMVGPRTSDVSAGEARPLDDRPGRTGVLELIEPRTSTLAIGPPSDAVGHPKAWFEVAPSTLAELAGSDPRAVDVVIVAGPPSARPNAEEGGLLVVAVPSVAPFFRASAREIAQDLLLVIAFSMVLVTLYTYEAMRAEVQRRRFEIGIWRGVGLRRSEIASLLLGRSAALSALGAIVGSVLAVVLLRVAHRATGLELLRDAVSWSTIGALVLAFVVAGALGGLFPALAAARAPVTSRPPPSSRRSIVAPLAILVALMTLNVVFYSGVAASPERFFADSIVLGPNDGSLLGQGSVSAELLEPLAAVPEVSATSPEVYATVALQGHSVMVRGVVLESFASLQRIELVSGALALDGDAAIAGAGFAQQQGAAVGDIVLLPSPFTRIAIPVRIGGIAEIDGPARDELLVPLATGQALVGLPASEVHAIRVKAGVRANVTALLGSVAPTFTYSSVNISATTAVPGEQMRAELNVTNWGRIEGSHVVYVRSSGAVVGSASIHLGPRETRQIVVPFKLSDVGRTDISINPTFTVDVQAPTLAVRVERPIVFPGEALEAQVTGAAGAPAAGIVVEANGQFNRTDDTGRVGFVVPDGSLLEVVAYDEGRAAAVRSLAIGERGMAETAFARVLSVRVPQGYAVVGRPVTLEVEVLNAGGRAGPLRLEVLEGDTPLGAGEIRLEPGASGTLAIELEPLGAGSHTITVLRQRLSVTSYDSRDPRVDIYLESLRRALEAEPPPALPADAVGDYVIRITGNIRFATTLLSIASLGLATLGIAAVVRRQVAEMEPTLGTLKAIGARDRRVMNHAAGRVAGLASTASLLGVVAGAVLAIVLGRTGEVRAFGHAVGPAIEWNVMAMILVVTPTLAALLANAAAYVALRHTPDALIRNEATPRPPPSIPSLGDAITRRP